LNVSVGQVLFDEVGKVAKWTIGNIDEKKRPQLTGSIVLNSDKRPENHPPLSLSWKIPLGSWSGLTVNGMSLTGESYKPYKGVRNIAKSGRYQIRCS
jgi:AP-3 complex subunit mu